MSKLPVEVKFIDGKVAEFGITYATPGSAAFDLRAVLSEPLVLEPGDVKLIPTGLAVWVKDPAFAGYILPRSGSGHKHGIVLGNLVGLIDSDYQDELKMSLWNRSNVTYTIQPYERVAQYVVGPVFQIDPIVVTEFSDVSERGLNGFGSSGKQ